MPVESASDLAGFFDTGDFAEPGQWTLAAGGAAKAVPVIMDRPDELVGLGGSVGVRMPELTARCAVTDLPAGYGKGDSLAVDAETWRVERVDLDTTRKVATVSLRATV